MELALSATSHRNRRYLSASTFCAGYLLTWQEFSFCLIALRRALTASSDLVQSGPGLRFFQVIFATHGAALLKLAWYCPVLPFDLGDRHGAEPCGLPIWVVPIALAIWWANLYRPPAVTSYPTASCRIHGLWYPTNDQLPHMYDLPAATYDTGCAKW